MLRSLKDLESYEIHAVDGDLGKVTDFLFDDEHWTTRYMVTDTSGFWEGANEVLISPNSFRQADWTTRLFYVALTKNKVKNSPSVDLHKPVSRQYERDYSQYYGWPFYGGLGEIEGMATPTPATRTEATSEPHLRSAKEVATYHVCGSDGEIGHVADFIVDDASWTIRYLVIDTSNWWLGKKVLVAPHWAQSISWADSMVHINLTKDEIKNSPEWNPDQLVNREYEERLYDYYGRPVYWLRGEAKAQLRVATPKPKHLSL